MRVLLVELLGADADRPRHLGRVAELDRHAIEVPHGPVGARFEQCGRRVVLAGRARLHRHGSPLPGPLLAEVDEARADAAAALLGMHVAVEEVRALTAIFQDAVPGETAIDVDEPGVAFEIDLSPLVGEILAGEALGVGEDALERVPELHHGIEIVECGPANDELDQAGTSSSRVSGSGVRSRISRAGRGSPCSPSRFTQTAVRPSSLAGTMSWKWLWATWT